MILNIGGRTDIVNYYSEWFINRIKEGFCYVRNPMYPQIVYKYDLSPSKIDFLIMCSKNYRPIIKYIDLLNSKYRLMCHYTITGYGRDVEPNVPTIDESVSTLIELSKKIGKEKVIWRYDPILLTKRYTKEYIIKAFDYIASKVCNYINRVVFSFVQIYKKLETNFPEIIPLTDNDKDEILRGISQIAKKYGLRIQTCGMEEDYLEKYGIEKSGCTTKELIKDIYNIEYKLKKEGKLRPGCHCLETRDIGAYDSCPNGCKYCYANQNYKVACYMYKYNHNINSPMLIGNLKKDDIIKEASQKSFID